MIIVNGIKGFSRGLVVLSRCLLITPFSVWGSGLSRIVTHRLDDVVMLFVLWFVLMNSVVTFSQ